MNVLSLFSGIGGLELGLERAGMTVVGQVEIDPFCRAVLDKHWPEVPKHDDVRTCVEWWRAEPRPRVDLVCGGFPCQPVSLAGRQLAQDDPRWLWPAMASAVRELRPRYVLVENVPGLLARGMGDVLGDLAALGYDAEWDCIPAAAVGAPHIRDRVWIVAHADSHEHESGSPPNGRPATSVISVADADRQRRRGRTGVFRTTGRRQSAHGGGQLADAQGVRRGTQWPGGASAARANHVFGHAGELTRADTWAVEPDVGRVAHGVPARVDRLRALGNAVVPQVAEHVGRLILAAEEVA